MISHEKFDIDSARLMLSHLGRALKHYNERQFARDKLNIELKSLKKVSTKSMKKFVDNLQHSIGEAIKKEQHILKHQKKEDLFHGDIKERIEELETRLAKYLTIHEARAERVKLLENAMASESKSKLQQIGLIKKSLSRAEKILKSAAKDKKNSKQEIAATKALLEKIKKKVRQYEKNI
jgi:hypothetical protein